MLCTHQHSSPAANPFLSFCGTNLECSKIYIWFQTVNIIVYHYYNIAWSWWSSSWWKLPQQTQASSQVGCELVSYQTAASTHQVPHARPLGIRELQRNISLDSLLGHLLLHPNHLQKQKDVIVVILKAISTCLPLYPQHGTGLPHNSV